MTVLAPLVCLLAADTSLSDKAQQAAEKFFRSNERIAEYEYDWKSEAKKFTSEGSLKSRDTKHVRSVLMDGERVSIFLERNGKIATAGEIRQQEIEARQRRLSPEQRARKQAEEEKKRKERFGFLKEFPDAFVFRVVETKQVEGRPTSVVEFTPKPGFKPNSLRAKIFLKSRGQLWLDDAEMALVRLEAVAFEDMSIGGFLAHIGKGSRFGLTQMRVEKDVWLPSTTSIKIEARILFKTVNSEDDERYWNYKRSPPKQARRPAGEVDSRIE